MDNDNLRYLPSEKEIDKLSSLLKVRKEPRLDKAVLDYIEYVTSKKWNDESVLEKIRASAVVQKDSYWKEGSGKKIQYKSAYSVFAYMAYQMPGYVQEFSELFSEMIKSGLIRKNIRILDAGCGPGTISIAAARVISQLDSMTAVITPVEKSEANIEAYNKLVLCVSDGKTKFEKPLLKDITKEIPDGTFDLIVCSNLINELTNLDFDQKADLIMNLSKSLASDGSLVIIEPADLENSTHLRNLSREVKKRGLTIYAPCNDIRGTACSVSPCWTFRKYEDIVPTKLMFALGGDKEKFRFVNTDVKFSYSILRKDGHRKCGYRIPAAAKRARFSQIKRHVGKRIHVTVSVMSEDIGDAKNYMFLVCDGTGTVPVYAALPAFHRTPEHEALLTASYGSVVAIDSVLVRFNEKQNAYNLLLGKESFCRMIAGTSSGVKCIDKAKALREKYGVSKKKGVIYTKKERAGRTK